jgi:NADH-quinone oxidoreductase subunit M
VDELTSYWNALAENSALLLVVMPLVGALLVRVMSMSGKETTYFTALTNVWLTTALGAIMLVRFEANELRESGASLKSIQIASSLEWVGTREPVQSDESAGTPGKRTRVLGPDIRFDVGVCRLGLWSILIVTATTLACVSTIPIDDVRLVSRLSWLLITESALIGTFAAQDTVLLAFFIELSAVGLFFLAGMSSGLQHREAARRFFRVQLVSGTLLLIGLTGLTSAHWWMQHSTSDPNPRLSFFIPGIVQGIPDLSYASESAHGYWEVVSPWLFTLLVAGLVLRVLLVPLHASWLRLVDHGDRTVLALTAAGSLPFGFYAATSFVVPVFPDMTGEIGFRLMIWSVAAGVAFSLMTLTAPTHRRRIGLAVLAAGSVSFGAAFLDHPLAEQGGLLLAVGASGSAAALFLLVPESGAIRGTGQQQKRAKIEKPVYWFVSVCAVAGLAWLPLSGSFWGGLMVVQAVFARNSTAAFFLVGAVLCLSVAMPALLRTQSDDSPSTSRTHVDRPRLVALLPLIVILTWIALAPHAVTGVTN